MRPTSTLARLQLHSQSLSSAFPSRTLTTSPTRKLQRFGQSRAPFTRISPWQSRMVLGPSSTLGINVDFGSTHDLVSATHHETPPSPLSVLPLKAVLRSLLVSAVSSSKPLLPPALYLMSILASSTHPLLNPDKNPLLRFLVKQVFYDQFCGGETSKEVDRTITGLKDLGYSGVMLCYAKEAMPEDSDSSEVEIRSWAKGVLKTIAMAQPRDFVALKLTGAGRQSLINLAERRPPQPALSRSIDSICALAASRGVRLLFDAEQSTIQKGIDDWTVEYMRRYNRGRVCVYGTYQAYLKSCGDTLSAHLALAREEGFSLGIKLVRGAYLASEPRHLIHDTKAGTDEMYDSAARAILTRRWDGPLACGKGEFPEMSLVVATHNAESVRSARNIVESGEAKSEVVFAQLMGMADEISCTLLPGQVTTRVQAYKYIVWGSMGECMKYLLRRAYENSDTMGRTREGRIAMWSEVLRRIRVVFRLGQ